jgi:hypothetical protein
VTLPPALKADGEPRLTPDPRLASDVTVASKPGGASKEFWIAAVLLSFAAAIVFHLAPSLPLGIAFDEPLKVGLVLRGQAIRS